MSTLRDISLDYRDIRDQVYIITGGTGSLGSEIVAELAMKGARIILLCQDASEQLLKVAVEKAKTHFQNSNIYPMNCDLKCAECITKFVQEWLEPEAPRRLDGIIFCASYPFNLDAGSPEELEECIVKVNHLHQMHLLCELRSAFFLQPSNRDLRIVIITHLSYDGNPWQNYPPSEQPQRTNFIQQVYRKRYPKKNESKKLYFQSKLLFGLSGDQIQEELSYGLDKYPSNINLFVVDSGLKVGRKYMSLWEWQNLSCEKVRRHISFCRSREFASPCANGVLHALFCPLSDLKRISPTTFYVDNTCISEHINNKFIQKHKNTNCRFYDRFSYKRQTAIICKKCNLPTDKYNSFGRMRQYKPEEKVTGA